MLLWDCSCINTSTTVGIHNIWPLFWQQNGGLTSKQPSKINRVVNDKLLLEHYSVSKHDCVCHLSHKQMEDSN